MYSYNISQCTVKLHFFSHKYLVYMQFVEKVQFKIVFGLSIAIKLTKVLGKPINIQ